MSYSPYAPPRAGPHITAYYRPLGWKTMVGAGFIVASVVIGVANQLVVMALGKPGSSDHLLAALVLGLVALVSAGASLFASVLFLVWTHNAALNVRAFGQEGLAFTPGWCVGWWFVPVASLWKPYQALAEIWRASDPESIATGSGQAWQAQETPRRFVVWWGSYLASTLLGATGGLAVAAAGLHGETSGLGNGLVLASMVVSGVSAHAIFVIMRDLGLRQSACAEKLGLSARV